MRRTRFISLRLAVLVSSAALYTACGGEIIGNPMPDDIDGDGFSQSEDCDDHDPLVHPDADEIIDGIDNNCNGLVDCADDGVNCPPVENDDDGDGWSESEDCDDHDPFVHPDAIEACDDLIDNDCDEAIDYDDIDCSIIVNG